VPLSAAEPTLRVIAFLCCGPHSEMRKVQYRVTIAIVTYRSKEELPACLDSLFASEVPAKIVIIDNDSGDGTFELARTYAERCGNVVAVATGRNVGLAAGNNLVLPHLEGDYLLVLNPDTVLERGALSSMVATMDGDEEIGAMGPKCLYEDGSPHTSYHHGWGFWHLFVWRVLPYSLVRSLYDRFARYRERDVGFVSGACLLVRTSVFKRVGGYDPAYFLTVEDACDLCQRIRALGYRIRFSPRARITHLCGRSGRQVPHLSTLEGYKGDIYHFYKHRGRPGGFVAFLIVAFACAVKIAATSLKAVALRRPVDFQNLRVYWKILPQLFSHGPEIASSCGR
jgi:N-acetylglucosaminyl-diphospho-decaprenol L-rhamnosyltransferase